MNDTSPKAYSYLRFSTPEQMRGDSYRRQTRQAEEYAAKRGLVLDETFSLEDLGVSAYRGANMETGALGYFKEAIRAGEVPRGSVLLVESLDRISRQTPRRALRTLEDIVDNGVTVVTLIDGREYSEENLDTDPFGLMASIMMFTRAHEESATKSRRLKETWGAKRAAIGTKALTSVMPAWMEMDAKTGKPKLIPERQAVVERIFRDTLDGYGQHLIANSLNTTETKPWGSGKFWHRSYISKILSNEAVIGTLHPHTVDYINGKRTRTPLEPIPNYYPPAISLDLWKEVRAFAVGKRARARGRHANLAVTNMLAGLATCPLCFGTMTRVNKGKRSVPFYVCSRAKTKAGCLYRMVKVQVVEAAILAGLPDRLRDAPAGERSPELDERIVNAEGSLEEQMQKIDNLLTAIESGADSVALGSRLREQETEYFATQAELERLTTMRIAVSGLTVQARIERLLEAMEPNESQPDVAAVNLALQSVFRRVIVDYPSGELLFEWIHAGSVELAYAMPYGSSALE